MEIVPTGPARFDVPLDVAKVQTAGRWNSGFIVVGVLLTALCIAGLGAMIATGFGSWFTITLVAVFGVASIGLVVTSVLRRRMLLLLVGRSTSACTITDDGITLAGAPEIPWTDVVFVAVLNDRPRTNRLRSVPVYGWFGRLALKAGNGTILCEIAVRDGEALQRRFDDPAAARRVTLFGRWPDGTRRGVLPLPRRRALGGVDAGRREGRVRRGIRSGHPDGPARSNVRALQVEGSEARPEVADRGLTDAPPETPYQP